MFGRLGRRRSEPPSGGGDEQSATTTSTEDLLSLLQAIEAAAGQVYGRHGLPQRPGHYRRPAEGGAWPIDFPQAKRNAYDLETIARWLESFLWRFFQTSQFKRSAVPNGPKVVTGGSLSPRGDWRAPSDSSARVWLDELDQNVPDA